jgi:hypothetical protein
MHKKKLLDCVYKETFVISSTANDSEEHLPVEAYTEFFDVTEALNIRKTINDKKIKMVHGHLLPATVIPKHFNGLDPFIIVDLPELNYGIFIADFSTTPEDLAVNIEALISYGLDFAPKEIGIEDVFILYGTEITTVLSVLEEELDEELIEKSNLLVEEVKSIKQKT